jgi:hypothetical protein
MSAAAANGAPQSGHAAESAPIGDAQAVQNVTNASADDQAKDGQDPAVMAIVTDQDLCW